MRTLDGECSEGLFASVLQVRHWTEPAPLLVESVLMGEECGKQLELNRFAKVLDRSAASLLHDVSCAGNEI